MTFIQSIKAVLISRYFDFQGRSSRSEYWWSFLVLTILNILFGISYEILDPSSASYILVLLFNLCLIIPSFAVAIRRLHDIDRSGWWYFIAFIPLIGLIVLIYWFVKKGDEGINRFGDHYVFEPSENTQTSKSEIPHRKLDSNTRIGISGFDSSGAVVRLMIDNYNANEIVYIIGRNSKECDLVLNDSSVSRKHAEITVEDNGTFIKDLSSANGTMINNKILEPEVKTILPDSGALTIGSSELVIFRG
ncbi:MAG: DUF805 domain-containing protein [Candidatus Micropelagos thuwalensis]